MSAAKPVLKIGRRSFLWSDEFLSDEVPVPEGDDVPDPEECPGLTFCLWPFSKVFEKFLVTKNGIIW